MMSIGKRGDQFGKEYKLQKNSYRFYPRWQALQVPKHSYRSRKLKWSQDPRAIWNRIS